VGTRARNRPSDLHQATLDQWLGQLSSPNTRAAYRSDLGAFGQWCAARGAIPLTADTATLVEFQAARAACGDSPATLRRRWSALSSFYDFAVASHAREVNPTVGAARPRASEDGATPTEPLSADAIASCRALAAALDVRLDALVALIVADGLKIGEALALDIDDVARRRSATTITVRRRGETKRMVVDAETARALRRCVGARTSGPVFTSERGSTGNPDRLTRFGADYLIRQLRTDDPHQRVTANALRRFHVASRDGIDTQTIR
jgi:integrase/recombinase XerD